MATAMRTSTLQTMGLGSPLEILRSGRLPVSAEAAVDEVFGPAGRRGSLVISGANGIVGAGKAMQLGARLEPFGVPVVALDFPGSPGGLAAKYPGLEAAFGRQQAARVMDNITQLNYDGSHLPSALALFQPRFLLEAIPELLEVKRAHYEVFRAAYPGIEIRSVTSGFPRAALGVSITHPAFPHEINKVWEVVEPETSAITRLLWALGLIPVPVSDHWSFVLDVIFCGLTLAALRYHRATNMPFWKIDKYVRKLLGPNPFRAHDAIGARGANFLTWSCLHHMAEQYGELFRPTATLDEHKDSGQNWYPPDHFRPLVNWSLAADELAELGAWILGPLVQMTSLMLHPRRSHLAQMNAISELCAQFSPGLLATIRQLGADGAMSTVERYHQLHPEAAASAWYPEALVAIESSEWQQLYVNAEHDGRVGVIGISRESYNRDVDAELNRAIDWLRAQGVDRVVVSGDFHLASQMVGADIGEFFPALRRAEEGVRISQAWSATARRLHDEFAVSVGLVTGKRCLGGFLELLMHCHYLVAVDSALLGMPEVTLPVIPGMEGCHWPFRKTLAEHWPRLLALLLEGKPVRAADTVGWLVDFAGPFQEALATAWQLVCGPATGLPRREVNAGALAGVTAAVPALPAAASPLGEAARAAIVGCVGGSCEVPLGEALAVQARHSGAFMASPHCANGTVGAAFKRTMSV
jgi:enoyl-CoA hydratase/carnithine racemase